MNSIKNRLYVTFTYPLRGSSTETFQFPLSAASSQDCHPAFFLSVFNCAPLGGLWSFSYFFLASVAQSLLCHSRCFGPVFLDVPSSSTYSASPLYSQVSCLLFLAAPQYWQGHATGFEEFLEDICYETHLLLCRRSFSMFHNLTAGLTLPLFYKAPALFSLKTFFERGPDPLFKLTNALLGLSYQLPLYKL